MKVGTRVVDRTNHKKTGTIVGSDFNIDTVKWDQRKGVETVEREEVDIIGYDPSIGSQRGIWRDPEEERRIHMLRTFAKRLAS